MTKIYRTRLKKRTQLVFKFFKSSDDYYGFHNTASTRVIPFHSLCFFVFRIPIETNADPPQCYTETRSSVLKLAYDRERIVWGQWQIRRFKERPRSIRYQYLYIKTNKFGDLFLGLFNLDLVSVSSF
jgi:hypothetical protein